MRRQQHAWSVNHMSAPSPLSAGINKSSSEPGAASDELESQETNRGESEELCFLQVGDAHRKTKTKKTSVFVCRLWWLQFYISYNIFKQSRTDLVCILQVLQIKRQTVKITFNLIIKACRVIPFHAVVLTEGDCCLNCLLMGVTSISGSKQLD